MIVSCLQDEVKFRWGYILGVQGFVDISLSNKKSSFVDISFIEHHK
jgi:hypothetical protein